MTWPLRGDFQVCDLAPARGLAGVEDLAPARGLWTARIWFPTQWYLSQAPRKGTESAFARDVAPFARLFVTALRKLPLVTTKASRAVELNEFLTPVFDTGGLQVGEAANFWMFASFTTDR